MASGTTSVSVTNWLVSSVADTSVSCSCLHEVQAKIAKKAIRKAFEYQMEGKGFTMVEVLSCCPTNWGLSPTESMKWLEENMIPYYPLGVYKDKGADK